MSAFDPQNIEISAAFSGWIDHPDRHIIAAEFPHLADAAPTLYGDYSASTDPILLYKAWKDVLTSYPDYPSQTIGSCVSFGHAHANDLLQCIEIVLGEPTEYQETMTEWIYGESRKVGHMLGPMDGSYGSAAIKAMTTVGVISRAMMGSDGAYSGKRAKAWGFSGPPSELEAKAAPYKLGSAAMVKTWDDLVAAMRNGYPVTICSNQGFTMDRDEQGFCSARGVWNHCMMIAGVRFDREGACICQSWGSNTPSGPLVLDQPSFSFWAERRTVERILSQGDSWALSKSPDFKPKPLPAHWRWNLAA